MAYYKRFQLVTHFFLWPRLLAWFYRKGMDDVKSLGLKPDFNKEDFSCLLCGVSGEITAEVFINFVISKNKQANIIIIDLGEEQVAAVQSLVNRKYKDHNISVKQMNVLDISKHFKPNSFDWIETDGLVEYLDKPGIQSLLTQWKALLRPGGFITTRDFASSSIPGRLLDKFRMWFMKNYLTLNGYVHTKQELDEAFRKIGFIFNSGPTPIPTFKRYALIEKDTR